MMVSCVHNFIIWGVWELHQVMFSVFTPRSALMKSLLVMFRAPYGMPKIEPGSAVCKVNASPTTSSLWSLMYII